MTDHQFYLAWIECSNYTDRAAYVSDLALSSIWGDADDAAIPQDRIDQLGRIWDVHHMTIREMRAVSGLSQVKFGERYLIPRRTVEDWDAGRFNPADCIRMFIARDLGLITK